MTLTRPCKLLFLRDLVRPAGFEPGGEPEAEPRPEGCRGRTTSLTATWYARQDSNLRPLAPEANALSS